MHVGEFRDTLIYRVEDGRIFIAKSWKDIYRRTKKCFWNQKSNVPLQILLKLKRKQFVCKVWSENDNEKPTYENIFNDDISEQIKVNKKFQQNYQRTEKYLKQRIQIRDPMSSWFW
jgi:hypothetical protein